MAIVKWEPLLSRWWPRIPWEFEEEEWWQPEEGLSVYETDDALVVEANVPGVKPEEVEISIEGGVITIKAEHKETKEEKAKKKVIYQRAVQAKYLYTANIPCPVEPDKAEAILEDGVLKITLPKSEEAKPKTIKVKASKK